MGFFDWFTKAPGAVDKALDGVISGADKLVLTDEERLDYNAKASELWLKMQEVTKDENSIRAITRRYMAVLIMGTGVIAFLACLFGGYFAEGFTDHALDIVSAFHIGELMLIVGVFYFGNGLINTFKGK